MAHRAEIRTVKGDDPRGVTEPTTILVRHHRSGRAQLVVKTLSGGHILHLALATYVFNNVHRIAQEKVIRLADTRVTVEGDFNDDGTASTGMSCQIRITGEATPDVLSSIGQTAFDNSTIGAVLRQTTRIELSEILAESTAPTG